MSGTPWQDRDTLIDLYIREELSADTIGERLGCTGTTVLDWLDRHDIPKRDPDPPTMTGDDHPRSVSEVDLVEDYKRVADKLNKTPSQKEYNKYGEYSRQAIRGHFDGMGDIQRSSGLEQLRKGRVTVECEICGDSYSVKHANKESSRFCGPECDASWRSQAYRGEGNPFGYNDLEIVCEWCGEVDNNPSSKNARFCSQDCMVEWRSREYSGENHPRWKDNGNYSRGPNWYRQREKARKRDGHECQICGISDVSLDVHHIVPYEEYSDYELANRVQNLITLCDSCHSNVEWGNISVQSKLESFSR